MSVDSIGLIKMTSQTRDLDIFRRSDDSTPRNDLNLIHILAIEMKHTDQQHDEA